MAETTVTGCPEAHESAVRSAVSSLFGRDALYMIAWMSQVVVAALATPIIDRLIDGRQFGLVASSNAAMQVYFAIALCGFNIAIQRRFARPGGREAAARLVTVSIALSCVVGALGGTTASLWAPAVGFGHARTELTLAVIWAGVSATTMSCLGLLRARDRLLGFATVSLLQSVVAGFLSLLLVATVRPTATMFLTGQLAAQVAAALLGILLVRPRLPRGSDGPLVRATFAFAVPLLPAALGTFVLNAADRLMLHDYLGAEPVGRYQVAYNVSSLPMLMLYALNLAWLSRIFGVDGADARAAVLTTSRDLLFRLLAPVMVGLGFGAPLVLRLWAPSRFNPDGLLVVSTVVIVSAIPYVVQLTATQGLLSDHASRWVGGATVVAALVNIALNLVAIPALGLNGAALATLVSYGVLAGILTWRAGRSGVVRAVQARPGLTPGLRLVLVAAAVALLTVLVPTTVPGLVVRGVLAAGCVGWFLWQVRAVAPRSPLPSAATILRGRFG